MNIELIDVSDDGKSLERIVIPIEKIVDGEVVTVDTKTIPIIPIPEKKTIE
jgi:hypothetical protein